MISSRLTDDLPIYYPDNLEMYPLLLRREKGLIAYIISNSKFDIFNTFPDTLDFQVQQVILLEKGMMFCQVWKDRQYLMTNENNAFQRMIPHSAINHHFLNMRMLTSSLFLCMDRIFSIPDSKQLMQINMDSVQNPQISLIMAGRQKNRFIIVYKDAYLKSYIRDIDIEQKNVINERDLSGNSTVHNVQISDSSFVYIGRGIDKTYLTVINDNLEIVNDIIVEGCMTHYIDKAHQKAYLVDANESIHCCNLQTSQIEKIEIPGYHPSWIFERVHNNRLYFENGKKLIIYDMVHKEINQLSFKNKIFGCHIVGDEIYVVTARKAKTDIDYNLIKEGILELYRLEED